MEDPTPAIAAAAEPKDAAEAQAAEASPSGSEYDSAEGRPRDGSESGSVAERESGDGQESQPARRVDHDEDKTNPQYIPKRGTFYEHDDRTAEDDVLRPEEEPPVEVDDEKDGKKKVWQEKKERWGHDRFNDSDQAPKSKTELVAIYGYDIRNEEGPPRARRRRRYGRGPNKYTRNWEDENAYNKPTTVRAKKPPGGRGEDFPPLEGAERKTSEPSEDGSSAPEPPPAREAPAEEDAPAPAPQLPTDAFRNQPRVGSGRVIKPKREVRDADYRGFTSKTRQVRNIRVEARNGPKPGRGDDYIQSQNFTNRSNGGDRERELEKEMAKLNVQEGMYKGRTRQGVIPPRLQVEQKGSKRYSSIRQRAMPEQPFTPHSNYYANEYNQQGNVNQLHQPNQAHPSTTQVAQIAPPPLPTMAQVGAPVPSILQAPPAQFAPPYVQPPPFLQQGVAPPPFLPQQTPQIINYVPSQPQFPPGSFPGYQQQFNPVTQPTELYQHQPQTGITYYSADQQVLHRAPVKRRTAAIPIIDPIELRGKMKEDSAYEGDNEGGEGRTHETNAN